MFSNVLNIKIPFFQKQRLKQLYKKIKKPGNNLNDYDLETSYIYSFILDKNNTLTNIGSEFFQDLFGYAPNVDHNIHTYDDLECVIKNSRSDLYYNKSDNIVENFIDINFRGLILYIGENECLVSYLSTNFNDISERRYKKIISRLKIVHKICDQYNLNVVYSQDMEYFDTVNLNQDLEEIET